MQWMLGVVVACVVTMSAVAQTSGSFSYTDNGATVTITAYSGAGGAVTIPSTIGGHPVTAIGANAFSFVSSLTSVTIPSGVSVIGDSAFNGCSGLTSLTIPGGVTTIGAFAFSSCSRLASISLPSTITNIGIWAFNGCRALTELTIPSGMTSIPDSLFNDCSGLTSITIPSTITSIGQAAFHSCTGLTSVSIPNSIRVITDSAFYGCSGLTFVTIPSSVTSIQSYAFGACTGLTKVYFMGNAPTVATDSFARVTAQGFYQNGTTGWSSPFAGLIMSVLRAPTVTTPTSANVASTTVTLGGNVTSDGGAAISARGIVYSLFSANSSPRLGGVGVTSILSSGTTGIFTVNVSNLTPGSVYSYVAYATNSEGTSYSAVGSLTTIGIVISPPTVTTPTSAGVSRTTAALGGNVTTDGGAAINARGVVYALTSVNSNPRLGGVGVTAVGSSGTTGVFSVATAGLIPGAAYSYSAFATNGSGTGYSPTGSFATLASVPTVAAPTSASVTSTAATLGGSVTSDGGAAITARGVVFAPSAVNSEPKLGGAGVISIVGSGTTGVFTLSATGMMAATAYSYVAYATNSEGTSYSAVGSFTTQAAVVTTPTVTTSTSVNVSKTGATLGGNVTTDGGAAVTTRGVVYALAAVNSNPRIDGAGVTNLVASGATGTFTVNATGLTDGTLYNYAAYATNASGTSYSAVGMFTTLADFLYVDDGTGLAITAYTGAQKQVVIPNTIAGRPVTRIGPFAFANQATLTSVSLPSGVTLIGAGAFKNCTSLVSATLPNGVLSVGASAFASCVALQGITIPSSVASIGIEAFQGCTGLKSVSFLGNAPSLDVSSFASVTATGYYFSGATGYYPNGVYGPTNSFYGLTMKMVAGDYICIDNSSSVTIVDYSGSGGALTIPSTISGRPVTSIGNGAFINKTSITSVVVPTSVTSISNAAFQGCTGLVSVTVPNSVTALGEGAFLGCTGLSSFTLPSALTTIKVSTFLGCTGLTDLTIPASVASIEEGAFYGCTGLKSIFFAGNAPTATANSFKYVTAAGTYTPGALGWTSSFYGLNMSPLSSAPRIGSPPASVIINQGQNATFSVLAEGSGPFTYQWKQNGVLVPGANDSVLRLVNVTPGYAGNQYSVVVTNSSGSTTSSAAILTVISPLILTGSPVSRSAAIGDSLNPAFSVTASGATLTYQSRKDGVNIAGANESALVLSAIKASDFGAYSVTVTSPSGTVTSSAATLFRASDPVVPPVVTRDPSSVKVTVGSSLVLSVEASGSPAPTYQWQFNGAPVPGGTAATLVLTDLVSAQAGTYNVVVSNAAGTVTSKSATVTIGAGSGRQINLSSQGYVGTGGDIMIAGFVVDSPLFKTLLIRAAGPALGQFGVPDVLANPRIALYNSRSESIAENDDWNDGGWLPSLAIDNYSKEFGAFQFPLESKDSAMVAFLESGAYTVQVSGAGGGTGRTIVEVYDLDLPSRGNKGRLVNLATRALVRAESGPLISGFIVQGDVAKAVLIRAIGPSLAAFGVPGTLARPKLTLFGSDSKPIADNMGWEAAGISDQIIAAAQSVGAFALTRGTTDSVILTLLPPGSYTTQVIGADGGSGVALVEVYELP